MAWAKTITIDYLNVGLIAVSCLVAHWLPYHLFLFSYAVLGPAHYLTQISWLHDRKYFSTSSWVLPTFLLITLCLCLFPVGEYALLLCLVLALVWVVPNHAKERGLALAAGVVAAGVIVVLPQASLFVAILLPTVLHVFVFTVSFMLAGAIRTGNRSAYLALGALIAGAATFLLPGTSSPIPDLIGLTFFKPVVDYLHTLLPSFVNLTQLFGFLGFAYTYHYLNWFSKAEIIRWHQIPRGRLGVIIVAYALSVGTYAYDYKTGFFLLLFLSILHVLLEFPLNLRTFAMIAHSFRRTRVSA